MVESTNFIISLINLFSLILGVFSVGLIYKLTKRNNTDYLSYYFFFLVFAVVSGFCDWIIFNWVLFLVPDLSSETVDSIYHIFWDAIGFPSALFALFFLIRALNEMLKIRTHRLFNLISVILLLIITVLSFVGLFFRLLGTQNILRTTLFTVYRYVIPVINLSYLAFAFYKSIRLKAKPLSCRKFILTLFFCFLLWHFLSLAPINMGEWQHLIIFTYYMALFLPSIYLFFKQEDIKLMPENLNKGILDHFFANYNLTTREKELVFLLMEGKSNKEISEELFISLQTVKNYISKIYRKIGLNSRVQLVNFVRKHLDENMGTEMSAVQINSFQNSECF